MMRAGSLVVVCLVFLSVLSVVVTIIPQNARAATLYVGGPGPGNFTTINSAISAANPGDTVFVFNGTYMENVPILKTINLIGEDRNSTIIDAGLNGNGLWLEADWVNVSGFTVTRSKAGTSGLAFHYSDYCRIENLNLIANYIGVKAEWSHNNIITGTTITSNGIGVFLEVSNDNSIHYANVASNTFEGLRIINSNNNTLQNSSASSNGQEGVYVFESFGNVFTGNTAHSNLDGFVILASSNTSITYTSVFLNTVDGITISGSNNFTISENTIRDNGIALSLIDSGSLNITGNELSYSQTGLFTSNMQRSTLDRNEVFLNANHGFNISSSNNNTISNCTVSSNGKNGFEILGSNNNLFIDNTVALNDHGLHLQESHQNFLVGNLITQSNHDGIRNGRSDHNLIEGNDFSGNRFNATTLSDSEYVTVTGNVMVGEGLTISGSDLAKWNSHTIDTLNTVNGKPVYYLKDVSGEAAPLGAGQIIVSNSDGVLIEHLDVSNTSIGIQVAHSSDTLIANNTANSNSVTGIYTIYSTRSTIVDNEVGNNGFAGIHMDASTFSVLRNNIALPTGAYGFLLVQSQANTVSTNLASNAVVGIYLKQSDDSILVKNDVNDSEYGIYVLQSSGNTISDGNLTANGDGIVLDDSTFCDVLSYEILWSNYSGIRVRTSTDNTIIGNSVLSNGYGIYLENSQNNAIFHNDLVNNLNQAYDADSSNLWDDGYPSGGNYWSDYNGVDTKSGVAQNQPGSDGIGDTEYSIDGGTNRDRYPLMAPYSPPSPVPPSAPQNLQAGAGSQQITLAWTAPVLDGGSPITNYRIYRGTTSGGETFLTEIANLLSFTDTGLVNGQTYFYWITAVNAVGESPQSNEANAVPGNVPGAPTGLNAVAGDGEVSLSWTAPSEDGGFPITNYLVYRGTNPGGEILLTTLGSVNDFTDTGLTNGQDYYYKVSASNSIGEGAMSNEATATPTSPQINQPPTCQVTTPAQDEIVSGKYAVTGIADDADGSVRLVQVRIDNSGWVEAIGLTSWNYYWNTGNSSDGPHTIRVRSYDGTDYSTEVLVFVTVDNVPPSDDEEPDGGLFWMAAAIILLVVTLVLVAWLVILLKRTGQKDGEEPD